VTASPTPRRIVVYAFRAEFESLRRLAEKAIAPVSDEAFSRPLDADANPVAVS
jgi:hypothetical protein